VSHTILFNGGRDARGHLDTGEANDQYTVDNCIIACPPHPQHGGHSGDRRLRVISDQLIPEIDCLRITYGTWDHGHGEYTDVANAVEWVRNRYDRCGLFGYSFGAALAIGVGTTSTFVDVVSALAPPQSVGDGSVVETTVAIDEADIPTQLIYGTQDEVVDVDPIVEMMQQNTSHSEFDIQSFPTDHHFQTFLNEISIAIASFLDDVITAEANISE
jgi:Predicted hydrolase of the alpha/beta superfamily